MNNDISSDEDWHKFRKSISYVSQKSQLLHGSIKENILFGKEFSEKKYQEVKEIACIDFTENKERTDEFLIIDNGKNLSGGQAQRISIARSLYSDPKLLILDEATNQLNEEIEKRIIINMQNSIDCKIIIVTHNKKIKSYLKAYDEYGVEDFLIRKFNE